MSYQKKSVILQELEQAIRKKAQQKSRNKEHIGRNLQASIQKKKHVLKATVNKEHKAGSIHKNQNQREGRGQKYITLFNNEVNTMESQDFKLKKHNNRRFDKLVSLIQYMVSSSEKAIKYISSTNFEAEFALKLYRSDKENLLNEIKNFNIQDLIEGCRGHEAGQNNTLIEENNKLKKDILVLEKEAEQFHKSNSQEKYLNFRSVEKENIKLKEMVRKLTPFQNYRQLVQILEKESKFDAMALKCQENSRKVTEIQIVVSSLENQRNQMLENLARGKSQQQTERNYKIVQIQSQKEQLQRQIGVLKGKITELKESSKVISQYDLVKKNNEVVHEKLISLANWASGNSLSPSKRHSETMIEFIRSKLEDLSDRNEQLDRQNAKIKDRMEHLQILHDQLLTEKEDREDELAQFQKKMEKLIGELDKMRVMADQLTHQRNQAVDQFDQNQRLLKTKEQEVNILKAKLETWEGREEERQELRMKNSELSRQVQNLSKRVEERQRYAKDKIDRLQVDKNQVEQKLQELNEVLERQRNQISDILRANQSRDDDRELTLEKMKIQQNLFLEQHNAKMEQAEKEVVSQKERYQKLMKTYEDSNEYYKSLTESYQQKHERVNELESILSEMKERLQNLEEEKERMGSSRNTEVQYKMRELEGKIQLLRKENEQIKEENHEESSVNRTSNQDEQNILLREENQELQAHIQKLESQLNDLRSDKDEVEGRLKRQEVCTKQLQIEVSELKNIKSSQEEEIKNLLQRLNEQNQKHAQQTSELGKKIHQSEMLSIALKRQKLQAEQKAEMERTTADSLKSKIKMLEEEIEESKAEIYSIHSASIYIKKDKEQLDKLVQQMEEEKQQIKHELISAQQQIEDQGEINRYKMKQYTSLLKQILKGFSIPSQSFEDISSFQELLQFGSKQVLELRKKQRDEESNKRRNNRRDDQSEGSSQNNSPDLSTVKVQLFDVKENSEDKIDSLQISQKKGGTDRNNEEALEIEQFGEMRDDGNESVASEDNRHQLEQFKDFGSERMNQSMISRDEENVEKIQSGNDLSDFREMDESNVNDSMISATQEENKVNQKSFEKEKEAEHSKEQKVQQKQDVSPPKEQKTLQMSYKPQIIEDMSNIHSLEGQLTNFMEQNASKFDQSSIGQKEEFNFSGPTTNFLTKSDNANKDTNTKVNLQQFMEINSQNNESFMSKSEVRVEEGSIKAEQNSVEIEKKEKVEAKPIMKFKSLQQSVKSMSPEGQAAAFQQFNNMSQNKADSSMMSERGLSQFGDIPQQELSGSIATVKKESSQSLGLSQFGEIKQDEVNQSIVSEKEHGMEQFGDIKEDEANQSIVSQNGQGLEEFGDIKQEQANESIVSEKGLEQFGEIKEDEANQSIISEKGQGLQQFGDIKEEQANQSIISEKGQGLQQFGQMKEEEANQSIISQKEHGMEQFGQLNQANNQSILSRKSEHGLSDFGDLENNPDSSMISQREVKMEEEEKGEVKGSDLDQFEEFKADKMNDSVISETDGKN